MGLGEAEIHVYQFVVLEVHSNCSGARANYKNSWEKGGFLIINI